MKAMVWTFAKPNPESMVVGTHIAIWLSRLLKLPLHYDEAALKEKQIDVLIVVNRAFAFSHTLEILAQLVLRAKRIIWVQNDYTVVPPKATSTGQSPFRAAFRKRAQKKLPPMDMWTTVMENATATPLSRYLNWNQLAYLPLSAKARRHEHSEPTLLYYGSYRDFGKAWRGGRGNYFKRYLRGDLGVRVVISSPSDGFAQFAGKNVNVLAAIPKDQFMTELSSAGLGLYIEDVKSHGGNHSPATRFYEMLAAGLPMVFQPEAIAGLQRAGFDANPYVLPLGGEKARLVACMKERAHMAQEQQRLWTKVNWRKQLEADTLKAWAAYKRKA